MPTKSFNPSPTMRLDYEITRATASPGRSTIATSTRRPDTTNSAQLPFPNSLQTGSQQSTRWTTSESLRSTFGDTVFNEFRVGGSGGATLFSPEFATDMFSDTNGYRLNFNGACCGTGAAAHQLEPGFRPVVARGLDQGAREHHHLAEGQSQPAVRRARWCRRDVWLAEPDPGADGELRHQCDRRSAVDAHVQRDDAARRLRGRHHAGEESLRDADRPHYSR